MVFSSVSRLLGAQTKISERMHRKSRSHRRHQIIRFESRNNCGKMEDIARRIYMCVRVRIDLNKLHMSFSRARVTQPV